MTNITYSWGSDYLLIELGNRINTRIKAQYWTELLVLSGTATILTIEAFSVNRFLSVLAIGGATFLYLLAAYRFFSRMFLNEKVLLDKENLVIITTTPFRKKIINYSLQYIGPLHYACKAPKTSHALKRGDFDYAGLGTQQHLTQSLHQEGNMYFSYFGQAVCFAKSVHSSDAEEMIDMMKIYSGAKLKLSPEWQQMLEA